jgi:signal transduction histidine kinase
MSGQQQTTEVGLPAVAAARPATERAYGGTLEALVAIREKLVTLVRGSSGERLASGYWLTVSPTNLLDQIAELNGVMGSITRDLQRTMRGSAPAESTGLLLFGRLGVLCAQFRTSTEIICDFDVRACDTRFHARICDVVYHTIAELLTNVRKHARATTVTLSSGVRDDGYVFFRVADNGVGMKVPLVPRAPHGGGPMGLWSIEHRLTQLDGYIEVTATGGCTVTIGLPSWYVVR